MYAIRSYYGHFFIKNFHNIFSPILFVVVGWAMYLAFENNFALHTILIYFVTISAVPWAFESYKTIGWYAISITIFTGIV